MRANVKGGEEKVMFLSRDLTAGLFRRCHFDDSAQAEEEKSRELRFDTKRFLTLVPLSAERV